MTQTNLAQTEREPDLFLQRLYVGFQGKSAYDQRFHAGLNIIRSKGNGAGKSTVCEFIFYLLGGDVTEWTRLSQKCDFVCGQFLIRGATITLMRKLPKEGSRPSIGVYFGDMQKSFSDLKSWLYYPSRRSDSVESFSQILFRLLGLPEHRTGAETNVTIHEILRLLYSDQLTSPAQIFRAQQFDSAETRQTVGEIVLGYDGFELHTMRQKLRALETEKTSLESQLKTIKSLLDASYPEYRLADFNKEESDILDQVSAIQAELAKIDKKVSSNDPSIKRFENKAEKTLSTLSQRYAAVALEVRNLHENIISFQADIDDSKRFIDSLERKKQALHSSIKVIAELGSVSFERCPACLETISPIAGDAPTCHLCRAPLSAGDLITKRTRASHEISQQLKESAQILFEKKSAIEKLKPELIRKEKERANIQAEYRVITNSPNPLEQRQRDLLTTLGYLRKKSEDVSEKRVLARRIEQIEEAVVGVSANITIIERDIRSRGDKMKARREVVEKNISDLVLSILHRDVLADDTLRLAQSFDYDFYRNRLVISGDIATRISASSTSLLKSAFFIATFLASLDDKEIRHPRFCIIDSIEDKGLIPERVQNLYSVIIEELKQRCPRVGQIIITSSLISPEVNESHYCVGPLYTPDFGTLDVPTSL